METVRAVENEDESRQTQEVEHLVANAETAGDIGVQEVDPRIPGAEGTGVSREEEGK